MMWPYMQMSVKGQQHENLLNGKQMTLKKVITMYDECMQNGYEHNRNPTRLTTGHERQSKTIKGMQSQSTAHWAYGPVKEVI